MPPNNKLHGVDLRNLISERLTWITHPRTVMAVSFAQKYRTDALLLALVLAKQLKLLAHVPQVSSEFEQSLAQLIP